MNAPETRFNGWTEGNQRLMVAELARIKSRLRGIDDGEARRDVAAQRATMSFPAAIDALTEGFGLSDFERDLLLLVAGAELDAEIASLCAATPAGAQRQWATFGIALAHLPEAHWSALTVARPLRRWRFVEIADDAALVSARLKIDERILHFLAGINELDARLVPLLRPVSPPRLICASHEEIARDIAAILDVGNERPPVVQLCGKDQPGKRDVAARVAAHARLQLFVVSAEDIPAAPHELETLARLWQREVFLLNGALFIECAEAPAPNVQRLVERIAGLTFLSASEPAALSHPSRHFQIEKPDRHEQLNTWHQALGDRAAAFSTDLDGIAAEFRLSTRDIAGIADSLGRDATASQSGTSLWRACRGALHRRLRSLAQRIETRARWDDLILPQAQKETLRQIATHARHRLTVYERWQFAAKSTGGLGISVLFAGESGTGKTMTAGVLADELQLELFRIDLSAVVSKYIGETEKNLARVFDAAEDGGAILLFDEADALFGKRSEVKDSHDRYANIEVSYLLQRMEAYCGLAILTTNQKTALDKAFHRRLRFVVNFPFPGEAERQAMWQRAFPSATPTADLDFAKLARLQMTGGSIRNVALNAAFHAADAGEPVHMKHLRKAAHAEAAKSERPLTDAETRGWS